MQRILDPGFGNHLGIKVPETVEGRQEVLRSLGSFGVAFNLLAEVTNDLHSFLAGHVVEVGNAHAHGLKTILNLGAIRFIETVSDVGGVEESTDSLVTTLFQTLTLSRGQPRVVQRILDVVVVVTKGSALAVFHSGLSVEEGLVYTFLALQVGAEFTQSGTVVVGTLECSG